MAMISASSTATAQQATPLVPTPSSSASSGFSFKDVLDTINPLQHIPLVSGMYRAATGQSISTTAKLAGDTIYGLALGGGVLGMATALGSSVADTAVQEVSGSGIGGHILSMASSVTGSGGNNSNTPTPLVPTTPSAATLAGVNSLPQQVASAPDFFPAVKNHAVASGQYYHAQIQDIANKALVKMAS